MDIVIAGAPKCGTSSLFNWLSKHPNISPSVPKETRFFMDWNTTTFMKDGVLPLDDIAEYNKFFKKKPSNSSQFRLEATTQYLYQKLPIKVFSQLPNKVKIIFSFRDPSKRIYSSFNYTKNNLSRVNASYTFFEYVDDLFSLNYKNIRNNVNHDRSYEILKNELERSKYYKYLTKWENGLGADNIKVVIFEKLIKDNREVLSEIIKFLELSYDIDLSLHSKNKTTIFKFPRIHQYFVKLSKFFDFSIPKFVKTTYHILFSKKKGMTKLDKIALERLKKYFQVYYKKYESSGISTSFWN